MGSTVSTGKLIGAFQGSNEKPYYVMFEQTYSSNVYPHRPEWSALMIGDLAATLKCIFTSASSCEGGMLKGSGGREISVEGYVAGWMKELENPAVMDELTLELKVGTSYSSPIPNEDFPRVKDHLLAIGAQDIAAALEAGQNVGVSLHRHADILSAIYDGSHVGAWRVIHRCELPSGIRRDESLGWQPKKAKAYELPAPQFYKVGENDNSYLVQAADGSWICGGWAYHIIGTYVANLWESELKEPGSYRNRVKAYRNALQSAACVPASTVVVVDTTVPLASYMQMNVNASIEALPNRRVGTDIHISLPANPEQLYYVTRLPETCTRWVIAETARSVLSAQPEQLSLLG